MLFEFVCCVVWKEVVGLWNVWLGCAFSPSNFLSISSNFQVNCFDLILFMHFFLRKILHFECLGNILCILEILCFSFKSGNEWKNFLLSSPLEAMLYCISIF